MGAVPQYVPALVFHNHIDILLCRSSQAVLQIPWEILEADVFRLPYFSAYLLVFTVIPGPSLSRRGISGRRVHL